MMLQNSFDGAIREKDSSKREGSGVGIQSVRHLAKRNGGDSRVSNANGVFCAKVMMRVQ